MNAIDILIALQERERQALGGIELLAMPAAVSPGAVLVLHPRAADDVLDGAHGFINAGFEMGLLAGCLERKVIPNRLWPGSSSIKRYDLLEGSVSAAFVALPDGSYCVLGFFPKPGEN